MHIFWRYLDICLEKIERINGREIFQLIWRTVNISGVMFGAIISVDNAWQAANAMRASPLVLHGATG
jgi:hypothetical protein